MERITLDTNCLLEIITRQSAMHYIWQKILAGEIVLCVTTEILLEYEEILTQKANEYVAQRIIYQLLNTAKTEVITTYFRWDIIKHDPDDNKFVDCAIAAGARCIVSNDAHFRVLRNKKVWPHIELKTLLQYHHYLYKKK